MEKEAKIKIYDQIISYFNEIKNLDNIGKYLNKERKLVGFNLADFVYELEQFLRAYENI